jgi:hypothetical protein
VASLLNLSFVRAEIKQEISLSHVEKSAVRAGGKSRRAVQRKHFCQRHE